MQIVITSTVGTSAVVGVPTTNCKHLLSNNCPFDRIMFSQFASYNCFINQSNSYSHKYRDEGP